MTCPFITKKSPSFKFIGQAIPKNLSTGNTDISTSVQLTSKLFEINFVTKIVLFIISILKTSKKSK